MVLGGDEATARRMNEHVFDWPSMVSRLPLVMKNFNRGNVHSEHSHVGYCAFSGARGCFRQAGDGDFKKTGPLGTDPRAAAEYDATV
jgi:hypothetical protein